MEAFLAGELSFTGIADVVEQTLAEVPAGPAGHFEDLFATDAEARRLAREAVLAQPASAPFGS